MCQLAKRNMCTTRRFAPNGGRGGNCLVLRMDDLPRWIDKEVRERGVWGGEFQRSGEVRGGGPGISWKVEVSWKSFS